VQGGKLPILYSRRESARLLGISVRFLDLLIYRGDLQPCRLGSRVLIRRREIEDFAKRIERAYAREREIQEDPEAGTLTKDTQVIESGSNSRNGGLR
jgi:excisionase family DNA binding protein